MDSLSIVSNQFLTEVVSDVIKGLISEVKVEFKIIGRIRKKGTAPRPVRITVEDQGHRRKLLSRAKELKGKERFQRIYLVPDPVLGN